MQHSVLRLSASHSTGSDISCITSGVMSSPSGYTSAGRNWIDRIADSAVADSNGSSVGMNR